MQHPLPRPIGPAQGIFVRRELARQERRRLRHVANRTAAALVESLENRTLLSSPPMGINIRKVGLGFGDQLFADAMLEAGQWSSNLTDPTPTGPLAPVDANGWPTADASIQVLEGNPSNTADEGGTYALSFTGQATVSAVPSEPYVQVVNPSYDSVTNTTTAQVIVAPGSHNLDLEFTNTQRLPTDATDTGITNVVLMAPDGVDASTPYPSSTLFQTPIINLLANFSVIRFMDYSLTNSNPQVNWSDRTLPSEIPAENNINGHGVGGAWEYAVALGNATNEGIYIDIPEMATDTYITNLAELIDFGSDGVNPYTGPMGSAVSASNPNPVPSTGPVWAGLNPSLPVYIEYSNEVWSSSNTQNAQNQQAAIAQVNAGNSPLNYDGDTSQGDWAIRYTAERIVDTSEIFRGVFGNSAIMTRIRPLYEWQYNNENNTAATGLEFINNYYNNADGIPHVADPHPVDYYLWGGGGAWYGSLSNVAGTGNVTVPNAAFSSPSVSGFEADPSGATWDFSGTAGITANGSALGNPNSTSGTQAAYLQGTGSFSETVTFTGGLADLAFSVASTGTEDLQVFVNGQNVSYTAPSANPAWDFTSAYSTFRTAVFDSTAGPETVTFTGVAGTGNLFVSDVVAETANGMYNSTIQNISSTTQSESTWAAAFGLQMVGYEGGFTFGTGFTGTDLQIEANLDPRAEQADIEQMDEFYASGGDLAMYYDTTDYTAALTLDINDQNTSKIAAVQSVEAAPMPALNFGGVLPTTAGQSVTVANSLGGYQGAAGLYALDATAPGTYHVTLSGLQSGTEAEEFILDGQIIPGLTALPTGTTGNSAPALTFTITTPGQHALLLVPRGSGSISPSNPAGSITITAGAGPALPAIPAAVSAPAATVASLSQVNLSWTASAGASGYQIQRSSNGGNFFIIATIGSSSGYDDTTVTSGAAYTYRVVPFNSGGYGPAATIGPVTVVLGSGATKLVFAQQPTSGSAGIALSPTFIVDIENSSGSIVTSNASTVTLALASEPAGGKLSGTISVAAVKGVATFSGLSLNASGAYTVAATDGSLTKATSSTVTVSAGAATKLVIAQQPTTGTAGAALSPVYVVDVEDAYGNVVTTNTSTVALALASEPSGGKFSGTVSVSAVKGVATFNGLSLNVAGGYTLKATDGSLASATSSTLTVASAGPANLFTSSIDIGSPKLAGSASYSNGTYTVTGEGSDIWNTSDQFHYDYKSVSGNTTISAKVTSVQNTDSWAKAGVMIRSSTAANAAFADVVVTPAGYVSFQYRSTAGGACSMYTLTGKTVPQYVKLVRSGNSFSAYYSSNGTTWTQIGPTVSITMSTAVTAGLAVSSVNTAKTCTATFTNVSVS